MTGRPSLYSEELAETICLQMIEGKSLRAICQADEMPHISTVLRWLASGEHVTFANKYAHAREAQADVMDSRILDVADACTNETALADRVKIAAYQWRASKLAPKRYGDKLDVEGSLAVKVSGALAWQPPQP